MSGGILMPSHQHQFRVSLHQATGHDDGYLYLMEQVRKVRFDLKAKRVHLTVYDDALGYAMEHINRLACSPSPDWALVIGVFPREVRGDLHVEHAKQFDGVEMVEHTAGFDYGTAEPVQHEIVLSYRHMRIVREDMC